MKKVLNLVLALMLVFAITSCNCGGDKKAETKTQAEQPISSTGNFGQTITIDEAIPASALPGILQNEEAVQVKLIGNVESVCQMSGCWIDVDLGEGEVVHVTFKDDAFVLPKDAAGKTAIVEGVATFEVIPIDILKHLAKDEGKSQEEIDAITEPAMEYTLVASGVILQ